MRVAHTFVSRRKPGIDYADVIIRKYEMVLRLFLDRHGVWIETNITKARTLRFTPDLQKVVRSQFQASHRTMALIEELSKKRIREHAGLFEDKRVSGIERMCQGIGAQHEFADEIWIGSAAEQTVVNDLFSVLDA
jgi:hypothetical protein